MVVKSLSIGEDDRAALTGGSIERPAHEAAVYAAGPEKPAKVECCQFRYDIKTYEPPGALI